MHQDNESSFNRPSARAEDFVDDETREFDASDNAQKFNASAQNDSVGDESVLDFDDLAERYLAERRKGANPSVEEYAAKYPQFESDIRELFPALNLLEKGSASDSLASFSDCVDQKGVAPTELKRLKNFTIIREIGRGGMGVVYEAWDETLERVVALKVMKIFPGEEAQTIKRFQREAKMAAKLHHTNIVPVYGSDVSDGHFFYSMQLIDGLSLEQLLKLRDKTSDVAPERSSFGRRLVERLRSSIRAATNAAKSASDDASSKNDDPADDDPANDDANDGSFDETVAYDSTSRANATTAKKRGEEKTIDFSNALSPKGAQLFSACIDDANYYQRVADLGIQAARALDYASRHNVVHRDVKPSNLIVDSEGALWITDFGLAKPINENDLTRQGQLVGTLRYLAPEALEGNFSPLTDVYSLGLTLYEMLALTPAYNASSYSKLLAQVAEAAPVRPRKLNQKIPLDLETIVLKAIERSPEKRYSAAELADDLQRFLDERPVRARRVGLFEKTRRWCKRNKLAASLVAMIAALVGVILVVMSTSYLRMQALVQEKNAESQRAKGNVSLALDAFDSIFEALVSDSDATLDFFDESSSAYDDFTESAVSEKDAKALDELLGFYVAFASANRQAQNDPTLTYRSARAFFRTGMIRKKLGDGNYFSAFSQAFDFYQKSLDDATSRELRDEIILETAQLCVIVFENVPLDADFDSLQERCSRALNDLKEVDAPNKKDLRDKLEANLCFSRAALAVQQHRRKISEENVGFFDASLPPIPAPSVVERVDDDFDCVDKRVQALRDANDLDRLELFAKFFSIRSLWRASLRRYDDAVEDLEKADAVVDRFMALYPANPRARVACLGVDFVKSRVASEIQLADATLQNDFDPVKVIEDAQNRSIQIVDALVEDFPDSFFNNQCQLFIRFHFAKMAAFEGNLQEARKLLEEVDEELNAFVAKKPSFAGSYSVVAFQTGYAEFLIRAGDLQGARGRLEQARNEIELFIERRKTDVDKDEAAYCRALSRLQAACERVERLFDEAQKQ